MSHINNPYHIPGTDRFFKVLPPHIKMEMEVEMARKEAEAQNRAMVENFLKEDTTNNWEGVVVKVKVGHVKLDVGLGYEVFANSFGRELYVGDIVNITKPKWDSNGNLRSELVEGIFSTTCIPCNTERMASIPAWEDVPF